MPRPEDLTIGALSRAAGCNVETIRYYERIGLVPAPPRSAGGHRVYGEGDVKRLSFVRRCRELGFTLEEVRSLLALVESGRYTCEEVKAITLDHLADVRRKLRDLARMADVLERTARACAGGQGAECPIVEALYEGREEAGRPLRSSPAPS
jgi:MerR family mercuric resistance operon transcriptional regulator